LEKYENAGRSAGRMRPRGLHILITISIKMVFCFFHPWLPHLINFGKRLLYPFHFMRTISVEVSILSDGIIRNYFCNRAKTPH